MKRHLALAALSLAGLGAQATTLATTTGNRVVNGSFESYAVAQGSWGTFSSGQGWLTGSLGVEIRDGVAGTASDGDQFAELDTTGNSAIWQWVFLEAGSSYTLGFDVANRSGVAASSLGLGWSLGTQSGELPAWTATTGSLDSSWHHVSVTILPQASGWTTLRFAALGYSDSVGSSLDNVSLVATAVPEPDAMALLAAGLGTVMLLRWRRRMPAPQR